MVLTHVYALIAWSLLVLGAVDVVNLNIPQAPPAGTQVLGGSFQGYSLETASFLDYAGNSRYAPIQCLSLYSSDPALTYMSATPTSSLYVSYGIWQIALDRLQISASEEPQQTMLLGCRTKYQQSCRTMPLQARTSLPMSPWDPSTSSLSLISHKAPNTQSD